jgi:integrase/recombinase XerD
MPNARNRRKSQSDTPMTKMYLEPAEIGKMEEAATNMRDRLLIRLLFHLGCRISEALALEVKDIDAEKGTVTIQHLKTRIKQVCPKCGAKLGKSHAYCPKCGIEVKKVIARGQEHRRIRTLPIDDETMVMLKEYIDHGGPVDRNGKLLVFGINRHRAWQIIRECAAKAKLPKLVNPETGGERNVSPHRLRDAFAVNAVKHDDSGDGLRLLQEHLGHASFNTTARYRKVAGEELKDWYDRLWQEEEATTDGA